MKLNTRQLAAYIAASTNTNTNDVLEAITKYVNETKTPPKPRQKLMFEGKPVAQWAKETGVPYETLKTRLHHTGSIYLQDGSLTKETT